MSYVCLLLYLFVTIIRPQDWVPSMYGWKLVDTLAILSSFFLIVERMGLKQTLFIRVPQNILIIGLYIAVLMSHVVHTYFGGLTIAFQDFLIIFILFFLMLNGVNSEIKFKFTILFLLGLIVILVPQGIYQLEHGYGWAGQDITVDVHRDEVRINWIGIFNDPNDLALLFVMAAGFAMGLALNKVNLILRISALPVIGALLYGVFLTNSRGGLLALMATIYFFFIQKTRKLVIGSIIGGVLAFGLMTIGPSRAALINTEEASASARIELWYGGILMLKSNPLFGVGYDMFMDDMPQTAHNSFILAAAELGMIGLFFWMGLIYSSLKGLNLVLKKEDVSLKAYAMGLQAALVGFCAAAFFLSRTYVILPYMLFALSGSLMSIAKNKYPDLDFSFTAKDVRITLLMSVGILLMAYGVIKIGI